MDFLQTVLASTLLSSALTGLGFGLFRDLLTERLKGAIKDEYDQKLATLKAQLDAANAVELEQLKANLQIAASQTGVTFNRLHDRRVQVIEETHERLQTLLALVQDYVGVIKPIGSPSQDETLASIVAAHTEFRPFYIRKQLFLPRSIVAALAGLEIELRIIINTFTMMVHTNKDGPDSSVWLELLKRLEGEVNVAIHALQEEMRDALGDKAEAEPAPAKLAARSP